MIRPQPARWFEILAARDHATPLLESLAATGAVELETGEDAAPLGVVLDGVQPLLVQFAELSQRYRAYWPRGNHPASAFPEPPLATLTSALARLRAFATDAEPLIDALQRIAAERTQLDAWSRALAGLHGEASLAPLVDAGPVLATRLFSWPAGTRSELPGSALVRPLGTAQEPFALVVAPPAVLHEAEVHLAAAKGSASEPTRWLGRDVDTSRRSIAQRRAELGREEDALRAALERLHERHGIAHALADAQRLQWVLENVRGLAASELLCRITGWTSDRSGRTLAAAIDRCGAPALAHFPDPPPNLRAPLLLDNPPWVRPFELFARALGMPSRDEVDPSALLALAVPLMFGYMFGDVGQGLLIAAGGALLARRFAIAPLFVAGGLSAAAFGWVFGSSFSLHGLVHPLWTDPLADPLTVLLVPIAGGAVLMTIGLLLNAVAAYWRGELPVWVMTDAAFVVTYLGVVAAFAWTPALTLAAAGAAAFAVGHAFRAGTSRAAGKALGELAERLVQILINTLSFARVGAFALAHAGLSSAIVALMAASDSAIMDAVVLIVGNAVVIVLETLVVSIQTTRLVLFEFFTRFLNAAGRTFRPLPPPPSGGLTQEPVS